MIDIIFDLAAFNIVGLVVLIFSENSHFYFISIKILIIFFFLK